MAKQKKRKKHKASMPPLSFFDKSIYISLMIINTALCFGITILIEIIKRCIVFSDKTVIAYTDPFGGLLFFPFLLFIVLYGFLFLLNKMNEKAPIFGKKGITYGPPSYKSRYPLFMKNKPKIYTKPSEKRWKKTKRIIILTILFFTLIPFVFSFCGRKALTTDVTLQQYNAVNIKKAEYTVDEIDAVTLKAYYSPGSRYSTGHWTIRIDFTTNNEKQFKFDFSGFKPFGEDTNTNTLNLLLSIKSKLNPDIIEYVGTDNLQIVADKRGFDETETEMLFELFNIK